MVSAALTNRAIRLELGLVLCLPLLCMACHTRREGSATSATAVATQPSTAITSPAPSASQGLQPSPTSQATAPTQLSASTPSTPPSTGALAHLAAVAHPLADGCNDPRAVLAVRKRYDRSGRLLVQQTLLAFPEFRLVADKAGQPQEIDVYETIYGPKRFGLLYRGDPLFSEGIIARCGDAKTCNQLAALFETLVPTEKVTLTCGEPPATTGGFARVAELAATRFVLPDAKAARPAICARVAACGLREGASLQGCEGGGVGWNQCAAQADCSAVVTCTKALVK